MVKRLSLGDSIRAALKHADESRYQISKATGISQSQLSRFLRGQAGMTLANLDRLCAHLGVRVVHDNKGK